MTKFKFGDKVHINLKAFKRSINYIFLRNHLDSQLAWVIQKADLNPVVYDRVSPSCCLLSHLKKGWRKK